ncbi:AraC family transcriptional regulator [Maribacter sp. HS]|uniref:helix-turn-helix domain-containing protein n=1 Tax=Maribacter sp. HS TaxID=3110480 RepID=UPI003A862C9D
MKKFVFENKKYGFELLMDLHKFENNPNIYFHPTIHETNFFEILFFENANGRIELNGQLLEVQEYSLFFISPFQKKSCMIDHNSVKGFHLVFQNDFLSDFFDDKLFIYRLQYFYNSQYPQFLKLKKEEYTIIKFGLNEIIEEIKNYQNDSIHIIRSLLYFSLAKLNRLYSSFNNISPKTQSNSTIYKFKEQLEMNIREHHSVQYYCNLLKVTRQQLNILVKEHTNNTTKEIINNRLLIEIKTELRYTDKTINEIASTLNFSEPNNLTRFFIKMEGISPTKFLNSFQNDIIK